MFSLYARNFLKSCLLLFVTLSPFAMDALAGGSNQPVVTMTLEYALDDYKKSWGLMQRRSLPSDYGMLFFYEPAKKIKLWSFNCHIDLAVAFLDERGAIQEIAYLKAHPQMMDPQRPVNSLEEIALYPRSDPILHFFSRNGICSKKKACAALETEASFFQRHHLTVGDLLILETDPRSQANQCGLTGNQEPSFDSRNSMGRGTFFHSFKG